MATSNHSKRYLRHSPTFHAEFIHAFFEAYKHNGTIKDVATRMGMNRKAATGMASRLRKKGIELPQLNPILPVTDVAHLKKLAEELNKEVKKARG